MKANLNKFATKMKRIMKTREQTPILKKPHLHLQTHITTGPKEKDFITLRAEFKNLENPYQHTGLKPIPIKKPKKPNI